MPSVSPFARRRSTVADPLKKVTLRLHARVASAVRGLVESGEVPSADAFIEDAIVAALRANRRQRLFESYAEAAGDHAFRADMADVTTAFDPTLGDTPSNDR